MMNSFAYAPTRPSPWTPAIRNCSKSTMRKRGASSPLPRSPLLLRPTTAAAADVPASDALRHLRSDAIRIKEQTVEVVRKSLLSSDTYCDAYDRNQETFRSLLRRQLELPEDPSEIVAVEKAKPVIMRDIDERFGFGWLDAIRVAELQLDEAFRLLTDVIVRIPIERRHRCVDIALAPQFNDNLFRFQFAMLATQIVAHEKVSVSGVTVDQLADDLTYPPRATLLAACQGAAIRGQGEFRWLPVVNALSEQRQDRAALGLLFDAVDLHLAKPNSVRALLSSPEALALPPALLRGLLTAVSGAQDARVLERTKQLEQHLLGKYVSNG